MAIAKFGPVVVGLRGTVGGMTFSANGSGPYVKQWQRPKKVRSQLQAQTGNIMLQAASEWVNITAAQRTAWDAWAAATAPARFNSLGEPLVLSGFNWFVEMTSQLLYQGQPVNAPAPVLAEPAALLVAVWFVQATPGQQMRIGFFPSPATGFYIKAQVAQARSAAANSFAQPRYFTSFQPEAPASPINLDAFALERFGAIQVNRSWFLRVFKVNLEGLRGPSALFLTTT